MQNIKIYEIPTIDYIEKIDDPRVGMIFYIADIDMYYSVKALKEINSYNTKGDKVVEYIISDYEEFGSGSGGGSGLTAQQLANIAKIPVIQNTVDGLPNNYAAKAHRHDASEIDNLPSGGNGASTTIVDNLNSTSTTSALSANQGRVIKSSLDTKASFCNTITDLKNSNFKNGDIVKTLGYYNINDGGDGYYIVRIKEESDIEDNGLIHFLNNNLVAELMVIDKEINILQFGAKNDKSRDIGLLVNNLLSKYKSVYIPKGKYLVENTIRPIGENTLKIDGALYYTGNESCILVETMYNKITTFDIFAEGNAVKLMNTTNESKCAYNYIDLKGFVRSNLDHALILYSSQMGINYNEIHFQTLKAPSNKNTIYIKTEGTSTTLPTFVNENIITGGQCTGGEYGVYIDTYSDKYKGEVNGMKFNTISFEGVTNGVYLKSARANVFNYIRVAEVSGVYAKFVGECDCNQFNILSLVPPSKFDISEISTSKGNNNFINCEVCDSGYNRVAKDLIIRKGKIVPAKLLDKVNSFVVGTSDGNYTYTDDTFYNYLTIVSTISPTITLNKYFCSIGINELYVRVQNGSTFTLKDNTSKVIHSYTNNSGTDVLFKYICFNNSNSDNWMKIKLTPIW